MNKYELMYIIDAAFDEEPRKELIERVSKLITDNGGTVEKVDEWGKRRLAYSINYKNEGYYVLVNFEADPSLPREIERILQINENVLRYLIIKLEQKSTSVKPRQTPLRPSYGRPADIAQPEAETTPEGNAIVEAVATLATADAPVAPAAVENLQETVQAEADA